MEKDNTKEEAREYRKSILTAFNSIAKSLEFFVEVKKVEIQENDQEIKKGKVIK